MKWNIDPTHSQAEFSVRHMFTQVRGHMVVTSGIVEPDETDPVKTVIVARLDPATINTGVSVRDDHLRSVDFFDIQRHPEIVFQSTAISQTAKDQYAVIGTLSIRGGERPVTLHAGAPGNGMRPYALQTGCPSNTGGDPRTHRGNASKRSRDVERPAGHHPHQCARRHALLL